jgi:cholesterol transport system auxiliary component
MRRAKVLLMMGPLLFAGCGLLPQPAADGPALHVLEGRPAVAAQTRRELVLAVSAPRAAPGYDSAAMVYLQKAHALDHYATHRWADTPARMLGPLLMRALEDTRGFRTVVQAGSGVQADLRLDSEIVWLRQSFLTRPSRVEFTLRVQLVDVPGRRVLATRYVEVAQDALSDDASGGVTAANAAIARALALVTAFCAEASAELRVAPRAAGCGQIDPVSC